MKYILDFETDSKVNLKKAGAHKYARHASTDVQCCSFTNAETLEQFLWLPGDPPPYILFDPTIILEAHNATFERQIIKHKMLALGWPVEALDVRRWRCSMAVCGYRSLPLKLEKVAAVLHLEVQKGYRPRAPWTPEKLTRLQAYCLQDGLAEAHLSHRIGVLPEPEQRLWELDQEINDRGVYIDLELCRAAIDVEAQVKARLNAKLAGITGGAVETGTQIERLREWMGNRGYSIPDLRADRVKEWLAGSLPDDVRAVLECRRTLALTSSKKYKAALECVCDDGYARGLLQYHAASTGRWGGRLIQPQNFARPTMKGVDIEDLVAAIKTRNIDFIALLYGDPLNVLKNAVRGLIIAAPGHRLLVADFSSIEGVVNACVSRETWKVDAYRNGVDMYCVFASKALGREVRKDDGTTARQDVGKPGELGFGYEGGVGAWRKFDPTDNFTDPEIDAFKRAWREQHPMFKAYWRNLNRCAILAVSDPTKIYAYHGMAFAMRDGCLTCTLPSGRILWYNEPRVVERLMPWKTDDGEPVYKPSVNTRAWKDGQWKSVDLFGGLLTENTVSGLSRDCLVGAMWRCEAASLPIILTVHDEIVAQVPIDHPFTVADMEALMRPTEHWTSGAAEGWTKPWPVRAEGWTGPRYRKA